MDRIGEVLLTFKCKADLFFGFLKFKNNRRLTKVRVEEKECNSHVIYRTPSGREKSGISRWCRCGSCVKGSASAGFWGAGQKSRPVKLISLA